MVSIPEKKPVNSMVDLHGVSFVDDMLLDSSAQALFASLIEPENSDDNEDSHQNRDDKSVLSQLDEERSLSGAFKPHVFNYDVKASLEKTISHTTRQQKTDILEVFNQFFVSLGVEQRAVAEQAKNGDDKAGVVSWLSGSDELRIEVMNTELRGSVIILSSSPSSLSVKFILKEKKQKKLLEKWLSKLKNKLIPSLPAMKISFLVDSGEENVA